MYFRDGRGQSQVISHYGAMDLWIYNNINPQTPRFVTDLSRKHHVCVMDITVTTGFDQFCLRMFDHRGFYQHHINFLQFQNYILY